MRVTVGSAFGDCVSCCLLLLTASLLPDCCHVNRKEFAGKEYAALAEIHETLFAYDPYHITFGTIACGETWLWQEVSLLLARYSYFFVAD
jgi:hypothetical protein